MDYSYTRLIGNHGKQRCAIAMLSGFFLLLNLALSTTVVNADLATGQLELVAIDATGQALEHVVISLHSSELGSAMAPPETFDIMDQRNLQFAPGVLAVQSGTIVKFPNDDDVRHHVYSFSHPNAFELKLYHGESGSTQRFDHEGVVVLGCNIHDGMLGYLRVVNTPLFRITDANGNLSLHNIPPGEYDLQAWHPDLGMKVNRQSLDIRAGTNRIKLTVRTSDVDVPTIKTAHPLQSLFRD